MCGDCIRLHDELQKQAGEMYGLRRRINNLRDDLKGERRKNAQLIKDKKKNEKPHLRKGQKRGRFGRNG